MMNNPKTEAKEPISARLQAATAELRELEQALKSSEIDPRVLHDFRRALDYVRMTAWAVQEWLELRERQGDPYTVLPLLTTARLHRTVELAQALTLDLAATEVTLETQGIGELLQAVDGLHRRLTDLFGKQ